MRRIRLPSSRLVIAGNLEHLALDVEHLPGFFVPDSLEPVGLGRLSSLQNGLFALAVAGVDGGAGLARLVLRGVDGLCQAGVGFARGHLRVAVEHREPLLEFPFRLLGRVPAALHAAPELRELVESLLEAQEVIHSRASPVAAPTRVVQWPGEPS